MKPNINNVLQVLSKNHLSALKKLKQKKYRRIEQKILVEGKNLIEQLISNGIYPQEIITSEPDAIVSIFKEIHCLTYSAKTFEIEQLADTETPQSIMGVFEIPQFNIVSYRIVLYLDGIQDPGNIGTIFRTATAFNLNGIVLSPDCCEVFSPKVVRASLGSVFWMPSIVENNTWLAEQKAMKVGLSSHGNVKLHDIKLTPNQPIIIVIGSEANGIRQEVIAELTEMATIPISSTMESLNAAVAAGIAVYEITGRFAIDTK